MPNTEKQMTAMQMLRARVQSVLISTTNEERSNLCQTIIDAIDTELLATERQQLKDSFGEGSDGRYSTFETYYNETFKTQ